MGAPARVGQLSSPPRGHLGGRRPWGGSDEDAGSRPLRQGRGWPGVEEDAVTDGPRRRRQSRPARHYYNRRQRNPRGRNPTLELVVTGVVMALLVVTVLVFLFVYHDFPFRLGGP